MRTAYVTGNTTALEEYSQTKKHVQYLLSCIYLSFLITLNDYYPLDQ